MEHCRRLVASLFVVACISGVAVEAAASPWVLEEDEIVVSERFDFKRADREFLDEAPSQVFPLSGTYRSATLETSIRYGLVENVEVQVDVPIKIASYTSEPVILLPGGPFPGDDGPTNSLNYYQENVIDLSKHLTGVADIRWAGRYQIIEGAFTTAFELGMKTPTGYDRPAGTFGSEPKNREDFLDNVSEFVQPDNVEDDVTLGDGQVDLDAELLLGWSFPSRTFLRLDAGYRLRLGGAGDQVLGNFQVGQLLGGTLLLKAGTRIAYAVQEGEVIGISVAAQDPTVPAEDYGGTENLDLREVTLDNDRLSVNAGAILRLTRRVEAQINYGHVVWGRNIAQTQTISVGMGVKFDAGDEE